MGPDASGICQAEKCFRRRLAESRHYRCVWVLLIFEQAIDQFTSFLFPQRTCHEQLILCAIDQSHDSY